ncbi:MerR family transcriptional regulator [Vacuolonema iberomarrocanum]|uniref:MerR family transcriptional regulator n=1 Tax=Vacuolonema iberomarrocanum TaxID=3454632 RepID=UPI0019EC5315|nr:MerR family transcriptional regulator [filamentous cyanobacterium LEGE 07170]
MTDLQVLAQTQPQWSLDDFVETANQLLPQFLPTLSQDNQRGSEAEDINPRLVRYYASQGLMDKPLRQGREARYTYRHLLQLLVIRRLLTEGYSSTAIAPISSVKANAELEALLQGGVQLTVEAANPALAYLNQIKSRQTRPSDVPLPAPAAPNPAARSAPRRAREAVRSPQPIDAESESSNWLRIEVMPGLELHLRDDFQVPKSPHEQARLHQLITQKLETLIHTLRSRRSSL